LTGKKAGSWRGQHPQGPGRLYEYERSSDELLRQVKSTEGVDEVSILRREILDGLYKYERSSYELLRQVKKHRGSWWGQYPRDPGWPLPVREVLWWTSSPGKKAQRELTRKVSSKSWTASTSTRGHPMNFLPGKKHRGSWRGQHPQKGDPGWPLRVGEVIRWTSSPGKKVHKGVDQVSILEILDGLYEYERSSDELLHQVKKHRGSWRGQHSQEGDPGWPLRVGEVIRWTSSPGKKVHKGVHQVSILEILDGLYEYERSSDELLHQVKKHRGSW
jgi:hypothetical protein